MSKQKKILIIAATAIFTAFVIYKFSTGSCDNEIKDHKIYRPVTAFELKEINPELKLMLTGVVKSWKEEYFSFEVPGRILWVNEKGMEVGSDVFADKSKGTIIAKINPLRYELKLKSLKAKIVSAEAKAEAVKVSIQKVMLRKLEAIDANLKNAKQKFQRQQVLLEKKAVSRQSYDNAETTYRVALASRAEAMATVITKKAEYKALLAQVEELRQNALDAELNIKKCTLRTTYRGKIADVYANVGANVQAGQKVVKVVAMNPMLICLQVAANIDRQLRFRDTVQVFPSGISKPVKAIVTMKSTVADPNTHTFNLELFVQNLKIPIAKDLNGTSKLPEIGGVWFVTKPKFGRFDNCLVVPAESIHKDSGGEYVWKAKKQTGSKRGAIVYILTKQYVKLHPKTYDILGLYPHRVFMAEEKNVNLKDFLAFGVPAGIKSGDKVVEVARRWLFRPGDLVKVILKSKTIPTGLYVPIESIIKLNGKDYIYVLQNETGKNYCKARKINVKIIDQLSSYMRIESPELKVGDKILLSGVHYIQPDDKLIIKEIEEIKL